MERQFTPERSASTPRPAAHPASNVNVPLPGLSSAAIARLAAAHLARQPKRGGSGGSPGSTGGPLTLDVPALATADSPRAISGPLPPGERRDDDVLSVTQTDAEHVEIVYGHSTIRFHAVAGERYSFVVGPPIPGPPKPPPEAPAPGGPTALSVPGLTPGGLIDLSPTAPAPDLPQRPVHITTSRLSMVDVELDPMARVAPLAVWTEEKAEPQGPPLDVQEYAGPGFAQLSLDDTFVRAEVERDDHAAMLAGGADRPQFAYVVDPEWTGPGSVEKRVLIVASPGVVVRRGSPPYQPLRDLKRRLVPQVVRVPHPGLVPRQGTRFTVDQFVGVTSTGDDPRPETGTPDPEHQMITATSLTGVVVEHPGSGAKVSIRPVSSGRGAAYAYQVVPPGPGGDGEIRVVVGPGVHVDLVEPVPARFRAGGPGPIPSPRKSQATWGEGVAERGFKLELVEVENAARVPMQGAPIDINGFLGPGRRREPDSHAWLDTDDLPSAIAVSVVKLGIGLIPIVGPLFLIGDFIAAAVSGRDLFGLEVDDGGKVILGVGAVLSLIPLAGGIMSIVRATESSTAQIAAAAARFGVEAEELEKAIARVGLTIQGDDAALITRVERAILAGDDIAEADAAAVKAVVQKAGVGEMALAELAQTQTGYRLGLTMARSEVQNQEFSHAFLKALADAEKDTTRTLVQHFRQRLGLRTAGETEDAVMRTVRDVARAEGTVIDEAAARAAVVDAVQGAEQDAAAAEAARAAHEQRLMAAHRDLNADHVAALREAGADLTRVERMLNARIPAARVVDAAIDDMVAGERNLAIMEGLSTRKTPPATVDRILDRVRRVNKLFPEEDIYVVVDDLVNGNLTDTSKIQALLDDIIDTGSANKISELRVGAEHAQAALGRGRGSAIQLGKANGVGGDVVDWGTQEVFQIKRIATDHPQGTERNLQEAANQLAGKGKSGLLKAGDADAEMPPMRPAAPGTTPQPFTRIAQLEIRNPNNALYTVDDITRLRTWVAEALGDRAASVDRVVIMNGGPRSPYVLDAPFP